ncbi:MAG: LuxR C-terminal-related transcriptional regulator [Ornithinibacter sp.]
MTSSWSATSAGAFERLRVALGSDAGLAGNYAARLTAAVLAAWQGRHDEAEGHLARSRELIEDGSAYPNFAAARSTAWVLLLRGDALPAVDVAEAAMRREGPYPTGCEWLAPLAARGLADLVRTELDAGRSPEGPRSRLAALRDCFPHVLEDAGTRTDDYAQIAGELFVSEKTVSSHISNILHKTGTPNRVELAAWATRRGAGS